MKGIAIQTILVLLVGMLVAGIVIFLVYSYSTSSGLSKNECMSIIFDICTTCAKTGWDDTVTPDLTRYFNCITILYGTGANTNWLRDNTHCGSGCKGGPGVQCGFKDDCPSIFTGSFT